MDVFTLSNSRLVRFRHLTLLRLGNGLAPTWLNTTFFNIMHVRLKWGMHTIKGDKGILPESVWKIIAKMGRDLEVSPEDIARAWLEGFAELYELCGPTDLERDESNYRIDVLRFSNFLMDAIERLRIHDRDKTRSQIIAEILHEKLFLDDPVYAGEWLRYERMNFEADRMKSERLRLSEKRNAAANRPVRIAQV